MPPGSIDEYLATQPEPQRTTLQRMRETIHDLLPTAQETISWGMPTFTVDGTAVVSLAGFRAHCSWFPHGGEPLEMLADQLRAYEVSKGTLRFAADRPLPTALMRRLIGARLHVMSERVDAKGNVRHFYDNGRLKARGRMRGGELHGSWQWWRRDGTLMRTGEFRDGEQVGTWRTYGRTGELARETHF